MATNGVESVNESKEREKQDTVKDGREEVQKKPGIIQRTMTKLDLNVGTILIMLKFVNVIQRA